jgi:hypothetical protein
VIQRYLRCKKETDLSDPSVWAATKTGECGVSPPTSADDMVWDNRTFPKDIDTITITGSLSVGNMIFEDFREDNRLNMANVCFNGKHGWGLTMPENPVDK